MFSIPFPQTKEDIERLIQQAYSNPLTGLYNRLAFQRCLTQLKVCSIVMIIDVDNLKLLNTTLGHFGADKILVKISQVLQFRLKRSTDYVFHFGGDEFAILLDETTEDYALRVAEEIRVNVAGVETLVPCSVSIGLCQFTDDRTLEDALQCADLALYEAKNKGKNQVKLWENDLTID